MNIQDLKSFKRHLTSNPPGVVAYTYKDDTKEVAPRELKMVEKLAGAKQHQGACFAFYGLLDKTKFNRIWYKPSKTNLNEDEITRWFSCCVQCGLLPPYVSGMDYKMGFSFDTKISKSLLYVYLCNIRHITEEPTVVRASLFMVEKERIHPYAAVTLASQCLCNSAGHNYLPWETGGMLGADLSKIRIPFRNVLGLRNFLRDPKKYSETQYFGALASINDAIAKVPKEIDIKLSYVEFKSKYIKWSINNPDHAKAAQYVERFKTVLKEAEATKKASEPETKVTIIQEPEKKKGILIQKTG